MATIFCFTSTGNSLYTAKKIAKKVNGKVLPMNERSMKKPLKCEDEIIGFLFPVYFWGLPRMVERFIKELEIINKDAYVFAVATYGDKVYGALGRVKQLLRKKGMHLHYGANLKSVENYIPYYDANDSEALQKRIEESLLMISDAIKNKKSNPIQPFTIVNKIVYRFYPDKNSDRHFTVAPTCTGCGICQKVCPACNISIESGKPVFLHECEHCLACIQNCPTCAIDWKAKTQDRERYRNTAITLEELASFISQQC